MTHAEIDALHAGRELDALVAERVMGYTTSKMDGLPETDRYILWERVPLSDVGGIDRPLSHYSTSIADAWEVLEKIKAISLEAFTGLDFPDECFVVAWDRSSKNWVAGFHSIEGYEAGWVSDCRSVADTAPLAICRAAIKAVMA